MKNEKESKEKVDHDEAYVQIKQQIDEEKRTEETDMTVEEERGREKEIRKTGRTRINNNKTFHPGSRITVERDSKKRKIQQES